MRSIANIFIGLLLLISVGSCKQSKEQTVVHNTIWPNGVMYEIFVQSFADSNGDGIGDFNGMTSKLDYLQDLGIQGIWLMPIGPSPSYHKYDVTDYYDVHPDYGTMDDFKRFVAEAHKRNIRVVMDFVVNHSSSEHPWFLDAKSNKNSKYRDYYVWANIDSIQDQLSKKETTLDSDNITQWHQNGLDNEYYYGFFYGGMPDLNYDNPKLRKEMIKAGSFWLKEVGVDGFRLDAAKHIFPDEQAEKSHVWWVEFGNAMRKAKPDVYLVGEVWGDAELVGPYLKGLPSMFNFDFHHAINDLMRTEKNNGIIENLIHTKKVYGSIEPYYQDAIFVNNHDQNRLISNVNNSVAKNKLAVAILLTLPGTPYIYYGDEIGMLGKKPDEMIREPFLWNVLGTDTLRTTWVDPINSNDSTVVPLALQMKDANSTYSVFKAWIQERNKELIIREGDLASLNVEGNLLAYERKLGEKRLIVLHNLSGTQVEVKLADLVCSQINFFIGEKPSIHQGVITLEPYQSVILK